MTAGSGIIHQEMPKGQNGLMGGLQLWVNLPASHKMMDPRYREIKSENIPVLRAENGVTVKIISGKYDGLAGPAQDLVCEPEYFDISIPPNATFKHSLPQEHTLFAYVLRGAGFFEPNAKNSIAKENLVLFDLGEKVLITADTNGLRFLLVSGKPIGEPVAWYGPIVMNTEEELAQAFDEYRSGRFIKTLRPNFS
jgi:redox-sensitive bicupin YhaK (pirin superfamily)